TPGGVGPGVPTCGHGRYHGVMASFPASRRWTEWFEDRHRNRSPYFPLILRDRGRLSQHEVLPHCLAFLTHEFARPNPKMCGPHLHICLLCRTQVAEPVRVAWGA